MTGPIRQEKQPASDEIVEVAPGVRRLQLHISMPGLGHVNCYAMEDRKGFALVDPGLPGPAPWKELTRKLARAGIPVNRVHTVVVTHSHPDHFGAAEHLRHVSGAVLVTHEDFKCFWDPDEEDDQHKDLADPRDLDAWALAKERVVAMKRRVVPPARWDRETPWGGPHPRPDRKTRLRYRVQGVAQARYFQPPKPSQRVIDGQVLPLGGREWVAVHTPGHTVDHLCLLDPVDGTLISGDHVLPTITPHISGLVRAADPLALYLESLERTLEIPDVSRVLPAHGHPFDDLRGRVKSIREHHMERLDILRNAAVSVGEASVASYSERLFRPQVWGPMADSETYAHLEHLFLLGEANRRWVDGELRYAVEPDSNAARAEVATTVP
jgi:glyoxylase-like metal-dependent hydrolase (beta-lactamase superfamily II)